MLVQNRRALWQSARIHRHLWSIPAVSYLLLPNGIHAHSPTSQAGTQGERGDLSCCQRSMAREEGMRLEEIGMPTGLGQANAQGSRADGLQRIIPLEELTTGTPILDMGALPEIKVVMKFPGACRAAHCVILFCCCVPLLAHCRQIIRNSSSKRSQIFSSSTVDFPIHSSYILSAPFGRPSPWKVSIGTGPDLYP